MTELAAVPVLALSGSVGVGKSTVLEEMHDVLAARAIPHACIELDALACSWPRASSSNRRASAVRRVCWS